MYVVQFPIRIQDSPMDAWAVRHEGGYYNIVYKEDDAWVDRSPDELGFHEDDLNAAALVAFAAIEYNKLLRKKTKDSIVEGDVSWGLVCKLLMQNEGSLEETYEELYTRYNVDLADWQIASCAGLNEGDW